MGNDIYMGGVRFTPDFDDMGTPQEQWYELSDGSGKGKVMVALAYQPSTVSSAFVRSVHVPFPFLHFRNPSAFCPRYISTQLARTREIPVAACYGIPM